LSRQAAMAGGPSAGSSRTFRLDPFILPVRYSATLGRGVHAVEATILLDCEQAIVKRPSRVGAPMTFRLPLNSFDGVAVRMTALDNDGNIEVVVELMHRDPGLCLPLIIANEPEDVAADWQAWSRTLNLPLLVVGQDGTVTAPVDRIGGISFAPTKPRRRYSFFAARRPRFLTRRKTGRPSSIEVLAGREIIARD
jgi:Family of unknown function (DUF6101)